MPMWAAYGDNHAGYCLEFANVPPFSGAGCVVYDDSPEMDLRNDDDVNAGWFFLKRTEWRYEEEVRIVLPRMAQQTHVRSPPDVLTRVILGERMTLDNRKQIQEWTRSRIRR